MLTTATVMPSSRPRQVFAAAAPFPNARAPRAPTNDAGGAAKNPSALGNPPTAAAAANPTTTVAVAVADLDCCGRRRPAGDAPEPTAPTRPLSFLVAVAGLIV